ncbi:MAG: hypothetical protein RMK65_04875 [Anaerolineae bacterium]|nr:hypothetical protein [Anaerolineae bacterium]
MGLRGLPVTPPNAGGAESSPYPVPPEWPDLPIPTAPAALSFALPADPDTWPLSDASTGLDVYQSPHATPKIIQTLTADIAGWLSSSGDPAPPDATSILYPPAGIAAYLNTYPDQAEHPDAVRAGLKAIGFAVGRAQRAKEALSG